MARQLTLLSFAVAMLLICCLFTGAAASDDKVPTTEAEFKKLKVKDLKKFLEDRGQSCDGCEEKGEFVRECVKHAATPLLPSKVKTVPKGVFWEAWANVAGEVCEATADQKKVSEDVKKSTCDNMRTATDSVFMQHGKRTAQKLRKKPDALLKTSFGEIYQSAGKKMFTKLAAYCFKNQDKCSSSSKLQSIMETDDKVKGVKFISYLTNVGIENTNPMYETLKDKSLQNEDL